VNERLIFKLELHEELLALRDLDDKEVNLNGAFGNGFILPRLAELDPIAARG
jgi:hypothetical protein